MMPRTNPYPTSWREHRPAAEEGEDDGVAHETDALHADRRQRDTDATGGHRRGVVTEAEREGCADTVEESFYAFLIAGGEPPATPLDHELAGGAGQVA